MMEPELLRTLERLENEELLDVAPELPLPATAGGDDYLSILRDLRDALGEPDEPSVEPETSFTDPQNILELDAAHEIASKAPDFENELELLPETAGFDFPGDEPDAAVFSNFELKLPDEILLDEEAPAALESKSLEETESRIEPENNDSISESADSVTANFECLAEPENLPSFFQSSETIAPEPEITEAADSVSLEDFLSTQVFNRNSETNDIEISDNSSGFQAEESALDFAPPEFFNEFDFEENLDAEPIADFNSPVETDEESSPNGFAFVPGVDEIEFPEILHEVETDEFSNEDFAPEETADGEAVSDFETENFAAETEDFSDFLPDAQKDFVHELDRAPELPEFKAAEKSIEILPEPSLADEAEETSAIRSPFVVFKLDAQHFAFPASAVAEIGHEPQFTALPFVPRWFSGVTNLRGDVIAVLDLRGLWEMTEAAPDARRKMLVVHSERENLTVGLLVDAVSEIRYLGESEIDFAPKFFDQPFAFCVNGNSRINGSLLPILDVQRFFASPKLRQL